MSRASGAAGASARPTPSAPSPASGWRRGGRPGAAAPPRPRAWERRLPAEFAARALRLEVGDALDRELLVEAFERGGYERVDTVVEVGQWSARGGIVDVFSPSHPNPARVAFLGDEIESIRLFDPTSQRSPAAVQELAVLPLATVGDGRGR